LVEPRLTLNSDMEVVCACDEQYLPHAATMLCSLLEHNCVSKIHFLHSSIANAELAKLKYWVMKLGSRILFYEIVSAEFVDLRVDKWVSVAVYYRLLTSRLLPADLSKVLYLDCDIVIRRPLNDLWNTDLAGYALAAVSNYRDDAGDVLGLPEGTKYFNSGVLLINLQFWRENNVPERVIAFARNNPDKVQFWDQDGLNATLVNQWIELPPRWNAQMDKWVPFSPEMQGDLAVVHFVTSDKPWHWANRHPLKHEYHKYRLKTPWWQYRQEGRPPLPQRFYHSLRVFARAVLPVGWRRWLRSNLMN
jgi:lipopolysaccharide biosynthesis glycosyltransferase